MKEREQDQEKGGRMKVVLAVSPLSDLQRPVLVQATKAKQPEEVVPAGSRHVRGAAKLCTNSADKLKRRNDS